MRYFAIIIFTFCAATSFSQARKPEFEFSIRFASCFKNDIVGLRINEVQIFDTLQITTFDKIIDITEIVVYQNDKGLWFINGKQKQQLDKILIRDTLFCGINLNGNLQDFKLALKKGKIIFFDNCYVKANNTTQKKLTIHQFKKKIELE
jgi:hypothetical protein